MPTNKTTTRKNSEADWLPGTREGKLAMAKTWKEVLALRGPALGVPAADIAKMNELAALATSSLAVVNSNEKTATAVTQCNSDFAALDEQMRYIKKRNFTKPPLEDADFTALLLKIPDSNKTAGGEIEDTVAMTFVNDSHPGTHKQFVRYKILGADNNSKAPYHMAVFQTYIQGPGDPDPLIDDDSFWSKDIICMSSPLEYIHKSTDVGKNCWYRARWEAEGGEQGPWTMAMVMIS
jgi:hypothetical protein